MNICGITIEKTTAIKAKQDAAVEKAVAETRTTDKRFGLIAVGAAAITGVLMGVGGSITVPKAAKAAAAANERRKAAKAAKAEAKAAAKEAAKKAATKEEAAVAKEEATKEEAA